MRVLDGSQHIHTRPGQGDGFEEFAGQERVEVQRKNYIHVLLARSGEGAMLALARTPTRWRRRPSSPR